MEIEDLKQRIKMKKTFEKEIENKLKNLAENAREILIKNDNIFNSTSHDDLVVGSNYLKI